MVLQDFSTKFCGLHGVHHIKSSRPYSMVHVEGCIFKQNAACGVATEGAPHSVDCGGLPQQAAQYRRAARHQKR